MATSKIEYPLNTWKLLVDSGNIYATANGISDEKTDRSIELAVGSAVVSSANIIHLLIQAQKVLGDDYLFAANHFLSFAGTSISIARLIEELNEPELDEFKIAGGIFDLVSSILGSAAFYVGTAAASKLIFASLALASIGLVLTNGEAIAEELHPVFVDALNTFSSVLVDRAEVKESFLDEVPQLASDIQLYFNQFVDDQFSLLPLEYQDSGAVKENFTDSLVELVATKSTLFRENADNTEEITNSELSHQSWIIRQEIQNLSDSERNSVSELVETLIISFAKAEIAEFIQTTLSELEDEYQLAVAQALNPDALEEQYAEAQSVISNQQQVVDLSLDNYAESYDNSNDQLSVATENLLIVFKEAISSTKNNFIEFSGSYLNSEHMASVGTGEFVHEIFGDLAPIDQNAGEEGVQTAYDELGNIIVGAEEELREDHLYGSEENDFISSGAMSDRVEAKDGDDVVEGGEGDDILSGEGGDDRIYAVFFTETPTDVQGSSSNRNWLSGGVGNDFLVGALGDDFIAGGSDDDTIYANGGNDYIDSDSHLVADDSSWTVTQTIDENNFATYAIQGAEAVGGGLDGNDLIYAGEGDDVVFSGGGSDRVYGESGSDWLYGEGGSDIIKGGSGNDVINGGSGDTLPSDDLGDFLWGDSGSDTIVGSSGSDEIYGGDDNDNLRGDNRTTLLAGVYHAKDFIYGGNGDDDITGDGGSDDLYGQSGDDYLYGDDDQLDENFHGSDFLDGGAGDDYLVGHGQADTLQGGDGNDNLFGDGSTVSAEYHGNDTLLGGAGNDFLQGGGGDDTLFGEDDDDVLQGDGLAADDVVTTGDDHLYGGAGSDLIFGMGGQDTISGGEGNDTIYGDADFIEGDQHDVDTIYADSGNDYIEAGGGADAIYGGTGNDTIYGDSDQLESSYHGNDEIYGGAGNDGLVGGYGDDLLVGGTGDDYLDGGNGLDTYVFNTGDGADFIADTSDIHIVINGNITSLYQTEETSTIFYGESDSVTMSHASFASIEQTLLGDQVFDLYSVRDQSTGIIVGTAGDDVFEIAQDEAVSFLGGLGEGNDTISLNGYSESAETYTSREGERLVFFVRDAIDGPFPAFFYEDYYATPTEERAINSPLVNLLSTDDQIVLEEAAQNLYLIGDDQNNYLFGTEGDDQLMGGLGDDSLHGAAGNNTYTYYLGDGNDIVSGYNGNDEIILKNVGLDDDIQFSADINDLLVGFSDGGSIRIPNFIYSFVGFSAYSSNYSIVNETTGTTFDAQSLFDDVFGDFIVGTSGTDVLNGTDEGDYIYTIGGNDFIRPGAGDDVIIAGYDYPGIYDNDYKIELSRGDGADRLAYTGGAVADPTLTILFTDTDLTIGDVDLKYVFSTQPGEFYKLSLTLDDGTELLMDRGHEYYSGISLNLRFSDGSEWMMIPGGWQGASVLEYQFGGSAEDTETRSVGQVGTNQDDYIENWWILPLDIQLGDGDDYIYDSYGLESYIEGNLGNDVIFSTEGDDTVLGNEGDDVLLAGRGSDILVGGAGDDFLQGNPMDGAQAHLSQTVQDLLNNPYWSENGYSSYDFDTYIYGLGDGVDTINAVHSADNSEQILRLIDGLTESTTVFFQDNNDLVLRFLTNASDSIRIVNHFSPAYDDQGTNVSTSLTSIEYDDETVLTESEIATLVTSDSVFAVTDNIDTEFEDSITITYSELISNDVVRDFGSAEFVSVSGAVGGTVAWDGINEQITFTRDSQVSAIYSFNYTVSYLGQTSTGTVELSPPSDNSIIYGSDQSETLVGTDQDDIFYPYEGDDYIEAGAGNDTVVMEGASQGFDILRGGEGYDSILGGAGDDVIGLERFWRSDSIELIDGGSGTNIILATDDDSSLKFTDTELLNIDLIDAQGGNDTIDGSLGNDTIKGGSGDDLMDGDAGDDTFVYEGLNSGFDIVEGGDGFDTMLGGDGDDMIGVERFWRSDSIERINGGAGVNVILASDADSSLKFTDTELLNIDLIDAQGGDDTIDGSLGDDTIKGGSGDDLMDGDAGDDTFIYEGIDSGYDTIQGGDGFDTMLGSGGDDVFGLEWFWRSDSIERIDGGLGFNVILGSDAARSLKFTDTELLNIDLIDGQGGDDTIDGSAGDDVIKGGAGNDLLDGNSGDDTFVYEGSNSGFDIVEGGSGFDTITGGDLDDVIGFERFWRSDSIERIDGGQGYNVILGNSTNSSLKFSDTELLNIDLIDGQAGDDNIVGSLGNDVISGGFGNDVLAGGGGNDTFIFLSGDGDDEVDFSATDLDGDLIRFEDVASENLWFERNGDKLIVSSLGSTDRVTLDNWFSSTVNTHSIQSSDATLAYDSVEDLLGVMELYEMPTESDVIMTDNAWQDVANEISSAWLY